MSRRCGSSDPICFRFGFHAVLIEVSQRERKKKEQFLWKEIIERVKLVTNVHVLIAVKKWRNDY